MHDLLSAPIPPESVLSDRFRVHPVKGDGMEPSLRRNRDYVLAAPVTTYHGEGLYLLDDGFGVDLYYVTNTLDQDGSLLLSRENQHYKTRMLGRAEFNERVIGIVVADIKTRNERFLTHA